MSNNSNSSSNSSFSHAFLPGLILGLIVGSVAGALLPDFLGGNKLPTHRIVNDGSTGDHGHERGENSPYDEETQKIIDDAMNDGEDAATDAVDDLKEKVEDVDLPTIPSSDD